ncbi:unnamed protein product [Meganyctiphanes norvegica]|uniref:Reelin domain-containing protein n=1 Tax=Meganyctiphanes norvegica TaxID=48144 RepID=A0AAV2R5J7_MEGNR
MKHLLFPVICLIACQLKQVASHSSGAPASACKDLIPQHADIVVQESPSPYSIITSGTSVYGTQRLNVTLKAELENTFKGFILQARKVDSQELLGAFSFPQRRAGGLPANIRKLDCDGGAAVTHKDSKAKTVVQVTWESSGYYEGNVVFVGSFVKDYTTVWVEVKSEEVQVTKSSDQPTTLPTPAYTDHMMTTASTSGSSRNINTLHGVPFLLGAMAVLHFSN